MTPEDFFPELARGVARVVAEGDHGTGFLHHSGHIITAAHIVEGRNFANVHFERESHQSKVIAADQNRDIALLKPNEPLSQRIPSIPLSSASPLAGHLVYTWGFPGGVFHVQPLLSVGYLAGVHEHIGTNGTVVERWYVNAAFNLGNSGGALMLREAAIGVISRKVAPLKPVTGRALDKLKEKRSEVIFTETINGRDVRFTEGEIIREVLNEFRENLQLVIGTTCSCQELVSFLKEQGIEPY